MIEPAPIRAPAKTMAWVQITAPASMTSAAGASRGAVERLASCGGLPRIAPSPIATSSPITTPSWTTTWAPNVTLAPTWAVGLMTRPGASVMRSAA